MSFEIRVFIRLMMKMYRIPLGKIYGAKGYRVVLFLFDGSDERCDKDSGIDYLKFRQST